MKQNKSNNKNYNNNEINNINHIKIKSQKENVSHLPLKKLHSKSIDEIFNKNNMIIAVRVRPLNKKEKKESSYKTIKIIDKNVLMISIPTEYFINEKGEKNNKKKEKDNIINVIKEKQATYKYDFVFDEDINQPQVYKYTSSNLIKSLIEGYNATIFAYGATGTGKTYTMLGSGANVGIMIRSIRDLFILINNNKDKKYIMKISYIEIYNEIIKDLLSNNKNNNTLIELRNSPKKGIFLQGAEYKKVSNENEAFNLIIQGNKNRAEKYTIFNENSSRSHAILQIYLEFEDQQIFQKEIQFGKFILLDLAGSEKSSFIYNKKGNNELGSINKSLLALNKCITLLASPNRKFIPWRESKLTRLLQESLSGNSRVVMIATVSQALSAFDETMFTLQYANRAKNLKLNIKKNSIEKEDMRINKYDEIIQNLKEEINDINKKILEKNNPINNNISDNNCNDKIIEKNKNENNKSNNSKLINKDEKKYDRIYQDILEHFENEINLKRKIIEKENIIEDLKNDLSQKEYEILHAPKINLHYLKKQLQSKREDIKEKEKKILKGYIKQNELNSKRKEFQKIISNLANNGPNNPDFYKLYNIYKYNINLFENMTSEHKKNINYQELKRKDKKIEGLMEQLDLRDQFIRNAYYQLENNNIEFKYKNPKLISSNQLENIPYRPKIIKIKTPITPNKTKENNIINEMSENIDKNKIFKKVNILDYEKKRNEKLENLEKVKKQLMGRINSTNKRQYNSEILSLFKNHPFINKINKIDDLNVNDFMRNKKINNSNITNENELNKQNLSSNNLLPINNYKKVHFILKPILINNPKINSNGPLSDRTNNRRYLDNIHEKKDDKINISLTTKLENDVQKKVKTILKKNYIGRYRSSPYLRLLEE